LGSTRLLKHFDDHLRRDALLESERRGLNPCSVRRGRPAAAPRRSNVRLTVAGTSGEPSSPQKTRSAKPLPKETSLSARAVQRHRGDLERAHWLRLVERGGSGGLYGGRRGARASAYEAAIPESESP
jgi:hypothetical protein